MQRLIQRKVNIVGKSGFTLVELLVSITIFVLVTALVIFKYNKFNSTILLTNLAYDVALTIRQAQSYGLNVRESSPGEFTKPYGVHFSGNNTKEFILYADTDDSGSYESTDALISRYAIKKGNKIASLCAGIDETNCTTVQPSESLSILFIRPNPKAIIKKTGASDAPYARITLESLDGADTTSVVVWGTGQISIE